MLGSHPPTGLPPTRLELELVGTARWVVFVESWIGVAFIFFFSVSEDKRTMGERTRRRRQARLRATTAFRCCCQEQRVVPCRGRMGRGNIYRAWAVDTDLVLSEPS
jgi:heme exporter protein D